MEVSCSLDSFDFKELGRNGRDIVGLSGGVNCLQAADDIGKGCIPVDSHFVGGVATAVVVVRFGDSIHLDKFLCAVVGRVVWTTNEHAGDRFVDSVCLAWAVVRILGRVDSVTGEIGNVERVASQM